MTVRVEHGDCLAVIPQLVAEGIVVDAVICDPPYHLTATTKRFSASNAAPAQYGKDGAMARLSGGFMGQQWDGGDIAFRPETWATVATVLRPGGFLLAFGGTRTFHRLVCAIEDAGFVIQDTIMWLYGSGFPKRRDMLKPAFEPICVAYKPGGKRTLQVDECRIGYEGTANPATNPLYRVQNGYRTEVGSDSNGSSFSIKPNGGNVTANAAGRWPANVCHDGSDEVMEAFPDAPGQSGIVTGDEPSDRLGRNGIYGFAGNGRPLAVPRSDNGSAARFFYCAKASREDRAGSRHPTVKPVELLKWLVPLVTPPGGTFLDPFAGSGTAAVAALATGRNAILIEREASYIADIRGRMAHYEGDGRHSLAARSRNARETAGTLL